MNLNAIWANLSRVYEIALLGDYSITLLFQKTEYPQVTDDYKVIKETFKDVKFKNNGDLYHVIQPPYSYYPKEAESVQDIIDRVEKARKNPHPLKYLDDTCHTFLNQTATRLNFGLADVEQIKKTARTIAWLENRRSIEAVDVAEATHYSKTFKLHHEDGAVYTGDGVIHFPHISINKAGLDYGMFEKTDVENAIKILKNYL